MPGYILLAAAILAMTIAAAIFALRWLHRRVRAHNAQLLRDKADLGGYVVLDDEDGLNLDEIGALMDWAADDPEVRITRPEGER